jgi:hypothetical protein
MCKLCRQTFWGIKDHVREGNYWSFVMEKVSTAQNKQEMIRKSKNGWGNIRKEKTRRRINLSHSNFKIIAI